MEWIHTISVIATVVACAYYIHRDIKEDMKTQTSRTDRLYDMFVIVQNEIKDLHGRVCVSETKIDGLKK